MSKILIVLGIVLVAGAGWYVWSTGMLDQPAQEAEENTMGEVREVVVQLAEQNDSGESGTATLTEQGQGVRVVLELTGAPAGVTQPAHIHVNPCATIGGVQHPLNSPVDGYSETMLNVSMEELRASLPLSINVHKSVEEVSVYVACGDIEL